jgi:hypothetical protein
VQYATITLGLPLHLDAGLSRLSSAIYSHPTSNRTALALLNYRVTRFWSIAKEDLAPAAGVTRHYRLGVFLVTSGLTVTAIAAGSTVNALPTAAITVVATSCIAKSCCCCQPKCD